MSSDEAPTIVECLCGEDIHKDDHDEWVHVETDNERCYPHADDVGTLALVAEPVEWVEP